MQHQRISRRERGEEEEEVFPKYDAVSEHLKRKKRS